MENCSTLPVVLIYANWPITIIIDVHTSSAHIVVKQSTVGSQFHTFFCKINENKYDVKFLFQFFRNETNAQASVVDHMTVNTM